MEPLFSSPGVRRSSFGGQIITVKCFEDNGLPRICSNKMAASGGSAGRWRRFQPSCISRCELARLPRKMNGEGLVIYGAARQVDDLEELSISAFRRSPPFRLAPQVKALGKAMCASISAAVYATFFSGAITPRRQHRDYSFRRPA